MRLPTLRVMPRSRRSLLVPCLLLGMMAPRTVLAQNASVMATATVLARPLTILGLALTAVPGELQVRLDGCGTGALTVDARLQGDPVRTSRTTVSATPACGPRSQVVALPIALTTAVEYIVTLEQSNALLSPSFSQVTLAARATTPRTTLGY
jgi:hypothetical protein